MTSFDILQIAACGIGLVSAGIILIWRRFGAPSWLLSGFLLFSSAASVIQAMTDGDLNFRLAIIFLILACSSGLLFTWSVDRPDYRKELAKRLRLVLWILIPIPFLAVALMLVRSPLDETVLPIGFVALGPAGYLASLYLLVVSVMALASLEQTVRMVDESVRWEIKFLILGMAGSYASVIFIASKVLLYSFRYALLPQDALYVFTFIYPLSCLLIIVSWRRSSGQHVIHVSQSFIYSSITLLAVGIYLIASSLLARWISQWGTPGIQTEAIVFLLSIVALAATLLTTQFRHRTRLWIRRNIFAGRYDYRHYWMEAVEKVHWEEDPQKTATALVQIVQKAIGSIDISVWLRQWNPNRIALLSRSGDVGNLDSVEADEIIEKLVDKSEPFPAANLEKTPDSKQLRLFMERTKAAILVPLVSSNRIVGILTVGSDRSGHHFDSETRDFLGVLGNHAASEFHKYELLSTLVETREMEAFKSFSTFLLHDLKNYASTLSLIARNAERYHENPDFQRDAFHSIFDTAEKMKRLCNTLRSFSTTLAANKKLEDLNHIVHAVTKEFETNLMRSFRLDLAEIPLVNLDAEEVRGIIQNLLLNAHQASASDGKIVLRTRSENGAVVFSVEDHGTGMPKEFMEKGLFQPFRTMKSDGLGIGLFQCKKVVEAHGGTIGVESVEGVGTTVWVRFPGVEIKLNAEGAEGAEDAERV
jgi:putative PEP-CTERM system histidine kinase